jgi:membrane-bound lytic murein transglycosylase MltF
MIRRMSTATKAVGLTLALAGAWAGCRGSEEQGGAPPSPVADAAQASPAEPGAATSASDPVPLQDLATAELLRLNQRATGDFDQIAKRRFLRALVPNSRTFYYLDGAAQAGIAYESLREFEAALARRFRAGVAPKVVIIPTSRDRLLPALAEGYGDIAVGGFTVTEARKEAVAFSEPTITGVRDVLVTGPSAKPLATLDDLAGREVHVRPSSSYHEDLEELNVRLEKEGKPKVRIRPADEMLEDEDVLQMVDAGVFPATVVKAPYARFWAQIYDHLNVHEDLALRTDGAVAWALRKDAPQLKKVVDEFVRDHRIGTTFGNTMLKRYLGSAKRLLNPKATAELRRFRATAPLFRKYAERYEFPWLAVAAQAYQESQLDQSRRSHAGAIGVMQIMPATGKEMKVGDIRKVDSNIHAGVKYMRFIVDEYFKDEPMDRLNRGLFAFASYNAGPAKVARLRSKAKESGLDPNRWFNSVELIAARQIGRETVDYVSNIYKYYTVYTAVVAADAAGRQAAATKGGSGAGGPAKGAAPTKAQAKPKAKPKAKASPGPAKKARA